MKDDKNAPAFKPQPDVEPIPAAAAIAELTRRGYDRDPALRYAKAARSHTERGSKEWNAWKEVEQLLAPPTEK